MYLSNALSRSILHGLTLSLALAGPLACDLPSKPVGSVGDTNDTNDTNGNQQYQGDGCVAELDNSLDCYAATSDPYLPLCDNPLAKEYWKLFTRDEGATAYFLPRPDESGLFYGFCESEDPEIAALFQDNALCTTIDSQAKVEIINNIDPAEALEISRLLHEQLRFSAAASQGDFASIRPFGLPVDLATVCEQQADSLAAIESTCARLIEDGTVPACEEDDMGFTELTLDEATLLADALNALYGIE